MTIFIMANSRNEHRLGLSIGRKAGNAVHRGRFKRIIREIFRSERTSLSSYMNENGDPGFYDIVISVRRHDELRIDAYRQYFVEAVDAAHRVYSKRLQQGKSEQVSP